MQSILFDLPYALMLSLLENWLSVYELCKTDSAVLCHKFRKVYLQSLRNPNTLFHDLAASTRVDMYHYQTWVKLRCVEVRRHLNIKGSYKFVCKKLPSLCDVVGSVNNSKSRSDKTEQAIGGVFNYTADSIESIISAMKLPSSGMRFLDAGCGNAIFLTLIRISFPTAEVDITDIDIHYIFFINTCMHCTIFSQVVGVDLQPVINTLQSIQTYCNYDPFKTMRLLGVDINTPPFQALVNTFLPTHAACIIGLLPEETAFLEVGQPETTNQTNSKINLYVVLVANAGDARHSLGNVYRNRRKAKPLTGHGL